MPFQTAVVFFEGYLLIIQLKLHMIYIKINVQLFIITFKLKLLVCNGLII